MPDDAAETGSVRARATIALALCAAVLFPSSALATSSDVGPAISEFETGLTSGVSLWGVAPGPDGNLWFTEENNNAVGRVTPVHAQTHAASPKVVRLRVRS